MPQAKIYGLREKLLPVREKVSEAVNDAISDAFKFPKERKLQRFFLMDREDFLFPAHERSDRYTIIEIETFKGRSPEVLRDLVRQIVRRVGEAADIAPRDIDVIVTEQPKHAWGLMGEPGDEIKLTYKVEI